MTAIKWCLFSYRLHFNQISLNYTVANAQSTVPNAQPTVHWTLLTEWCLTSYISVYHGLMKLGVVTIVISEMTAIKWYLFSYRLHFNQISLNYTVANVQSAVHINCALDIVNRMMSYIVYLSLRWSYEVGSCNIAISVMTAIKWYYFVID